MGWAFGLKGVGLVLRLGFKRVGHHQGSLRLVSAFVYTLLFTLFVHMDLGASI